MKKEKKIFYTGLNYRLLSKPLEIRQDTYFNSPGPTWFETKAEAYKDFAAAKEIAEQKAKEILRDLKAIQEKHGFSLGYHMEGDTHGIYEDYQFIDVKVNGYHFIVKLED